MIKSSIEKLSNSIGYDIGMSDDCTQADLLNGFCKGLSNSMNSANLETQCCYIADKLDDNAFKVLERLVEFIKLNKSNKKFYIYVNIRLISSLIKT